MKKLFIIVFILSFIQGFAQKTYNSQANFDYKFKIEPQRFIVNYDINNFQKKERFYIDLTIVDDYDGKIYLSSFEKDFRNTPIKGGNNNEIIWYWKNDRN